MRINFKCIHAVCALTKANGGRLPLHRLAPLLYLADKKSLISYGRTISRSRNIATLYGPTSENLFDIMNGTGDKDETLESKSLLTVTDGCLFKITSSAKKYELGWLSATDEEIINFVHERFIDYPAYDLTAYTCAYPEYSSRIKNSSVHPIIYNRDMLTLQKNDKLEITAEGLQAMKDCMRETLSCY